MKHYICPVCKTENKHEITFRIAEYVCRSCSNLIDLNKNISVKKVKKPVKNVVLEIGQKGIIAETEYSVVGIIVRKYGSGTYWREYYLKDDKENNAFLSESDGHWVFLNPIQAVNVKKKSDDRIAEWDTINYRWYETTQCHIYAVTGFFEDPLDFGLTTYKEYVNGTQMISQEQAENEIQYFSGRHISKYKVKRAFNIRQLPHYSGIGIVQPYYVNTRQVINIFCITGLLICLLQLYVYATRSNYPVLEQKIRFEDVKNREMISKSFILSGGTAPLKVKVYSAVDNSWANIQLSLVNERTNEIIYTSKDIEEYHGVEGGESWSEGGTTEEFNLCGVSSGNYHFAISAEKQESLATNTPAGYVSLEGIIITREPSGIVNVVNNNTNESVAFGDLKTLGNDQSSIGNLVRKTFEGKNLDSLLNAGSLSATTSEQPAADDFVDIKVVWLPVSFWNFGFILILMVIFCLVCFIGKYLFNVSKWKNSSNSPYPQS